PPHLERRRDDIVAENAGGAGCRPRERREDAEQSRFAGAVRAEQAEDRPACDIEGQEVDGADGRLPAAGIELDEIVDTNSRFGHGRTFAGDAAALRRERRGQKGKSVTGEGISSGSSWRPDGLM